MRYIDRCHLQEGHLEVVACLWMAEGEVGQELEVEAEVGFLKVEVEEDQLKEEVAIQEKEVVVEVVDLNSFEEVVAADYFQKHKNYYYQSYSLTLIDYCQMIHFLSSY